MPSVRRCLAWSTIPPISRVRAHLSNDSPMKFEHLIEINDPLNPLIDTLSLEQVWRGLVLRAESPRLFVPHLDECQISERSDAGP